MMWIGSVPERPNGPHSKCGMPERASEVRILPLPQHEKNEDVLANYLVRAKTSSFFSCYNECMDDKRVIATIKKVMPAVVSIAIAKHLEDLEKELPKELYPFIPSGPSGEKLQIPSRWWTSAGWCRWAAGRDSLWTRTGSSLRTSM